VLFVLMGVAGSGKSTVGACVAEALGLPFIEGDDYHPAANVQKMASGTPLTDLDRVQWLEALMQAANARSEPHVVMACSALTQFVRATIAAQSCRPVFFLHLSADPPIIAHRLAQRGPHFMKPGMLPSQLATLQTTDDIVPIDSSRPFADVCKAVQAELTARMA
jgi:gluconokinase